MNYNELFIKLQKQVEQVDELILGVKCEHENIREISKMFEKIKNRLNQKHGSVEDIYTLFERINRKLEKK